MTRDLPDDRKRSLQAALERRFGLSLIQCRFTYLGPGHWRCTDDESKSWIEGRWSSEFGRLIVVAEHNGAAFKKWYSTTST